MCFIMLRKEMCEEMKRIRLHISNLFYILLILLISGCEHDADIAEQPGGDDISDDKVQIEIFTRANSYHLPSTRTAEDEVGMTPWVLVFKGQGGNATFVEAVQAFEMAGKRYVLLTKQPSGSNYQLLILANPPDEFYYGDATTGYEFNKNNLTLKLTPGVTLGDACAKLLTQPLLTTAIPYNGSSETIPMSYLLEVDKIDNTTKIAQNDGTSLMLLRTVAKMLVVNTASNFTLKGITAAMNVPRQGRLHNSDGSIMNNTSNLTEYRYDTGYSAPLVAADAITNGQSTENTPIYLYESDTNANGMYILIQGTYEGKDYYYKMAIVDGNLQSMNILRNRAYTFTIIAAKGRGYDTVADAKVSKPSNMDLDFKITVDDSDSYEIIANNDYYLGVSNSVFIAYTDVEKDYEAFDVITDCRKNFPNAGGIEDNKTETEWSFGLVSPTRIPVVTNISPITATVNVKVKTGLIYNEVGQSNLGKDKMNAYITLKLGNLEKQVHIRRRQAIGVGGAILKYMPTTSYPYPGDGDTRVDYFCLTGQVEDGSDWIKLLPSTEIERETTDHIIVEDGSIFIKIMPNTGNLQRNGIVYLTTVMPYAPYMGGSTVKRIKLDITQKGV